MFGEILEDGYSQMDIHIKGKYIKQVLYVPRLYHNRIDIQ